MKTKKVEFRDLALDVWFIYNGDGYQKIGKNTASNMAFGYRTTFKDNQVVEIPTKD
mgnify:FL=1